MKQCDTCLKKTDDLYPLRDCYKTDEIQDICYECNQAINKQLRKIESMTSRIRNALLKLFMNNLRGKK
jgi:hypothetical protein